MCFYNHWRFALRVGVVMIIPAEMLTGGIAAVLGGVLKLMAKKADMEAARIQANISSAKLVRELQDAAAKRWKPAFARRFIAVFVTLYFFLAPALAAWKGLEVSFLYPKEGSKLLWGIFSSSSDMELIKMTGLAFMPVQRHVLVSIIGFFFGSEVVK